MPNDSGHSAGRSFIAGLEAWASKVGEQADALARQTCQETAERVHAATPVDTGNLRGNWQPSIGGVPTEPQDSAPADAALADISLVCAGIKAGAVFHMANNAAYARRLEYGFVGTDSLGRTYNQAGRYYVRDTVAKFREIVDEVAADLGLSK